MTHTSKGMGGLPVWPMKMAKDSLREGISTMYVHARLPADRSGRPGHLRLASAGCGVKSSRTRRLASSPAAALASTTVCAGLSLGVIDSTSPMTRLGR